jgi:hypothetical protein
MPTLSDWATLHLPLLRGDWPAALFMLAVSSRQPVGWSLGADDREVGDRVDQRAVSRHQRLQGREGGYGMRANLLKKLLATGLVLGLSSSMAAAQTVSAVSDDSLRPSWSDTGMADGWRAVCGDVRNVRQVPARSVAIRVQGLGSAGQVMSTRDRYVPAEVPAGSRAVFCVPMPAGATSYRVTVLHADWGLVQQP